MNFIEASQILAKFCGGPPLAVCVAASGNVEPLTLYVRAEAAKLGRAAEVRVLPFGTLGQELLSPPRLGEQQVILLMPWDFVPECDWRSGIPKEVSEPHFLLQAAQEIAKHINQRRCKLLYLPAPIAPLYMDPAKSSLLLAGLSSLAIELGAEFLDPTCFALGGYLASGTPISGLRVGEVAQKVVDLSIGLVGDSSKVLITDLDNVMWSGLAAEDGVEGIKCYPEGVGFRHFIYQSLLVKFQASGVILAAVSRNDLDIAISPITGGKTLVTARDFVKIFASYGPKSVHIRQLAEMLNLSLDAFVFIDDNPIELAEVEAALPQVRCLQFPTSDDQLPQFIKKLVAIFKRETISNEDKQRTEMYRRRFELGGVSSISGDGADLTDFLIKLQMELTIFDRTGGDRDRAVQLINKTNQFNLNGFRLINDDVVKILESGGKLFTVKLDDRTGSHGEILSCLIDRDWRIVSFVLSCRVFQRRVEHAFLLWLIDHFDRPLSFAYKATERNSPIYEFLTGIGLDLNKDMPYLDVKIFLAGNSSTLNLFKIKEVGFD